VIRAEPGLYLRWVAEGVRTTARILTADRMIQAVAIALAAAGSLWAIAGLAFRPRGNRISPTVAAAAEVAIIALGFFVAAQGLVVAVEAVNPRYTSLSALFLPGAGMALAITMMRAATSAPVAAAGRRCLTRARRCRPGG
jgi:hypothetical protein